MNDTAPPEKNRPAALPEEAKRAAPGSESEASSGGGAKGREASQGTRSKEGASSREASRGARSKEGAASRETSRGTRSKEAARRSTAPRGTGRKPGPAARSSERKGYARLAGEEIVFGDRTREMIREYFDLRQLVSLLLSLQRPFPHLTFGVWGRSNPPRRGEFGDITTYRADPSQIRVRIRLASGKGIACRVGTLAGVPIPRWDKEALSSFADFVGTVVESLGTVSRLAASRRRRSEILPEHIDLGTLAMGRYLGSIAKLRWDPTPALLHLRNLSQQTYENRKLDYGLILSRRKGGKGLFPADVWENRRFLALSDGKRTAIKLGKDGRVMGLVPLHLDAREPAQTYRPSRFDALAATSAREALGIGLSVEGDIVCLQKGSMVASLSHGQWQVWNHAENVAVLRRAINALGNRTRRAGDLARQIYSTALDLSFQRRGALVSIIPDREVLPELIEEDQLPEGPKRHISDRGMDLCFTRQTVTKMSREVLGDLASLDGAVIVTADGTCEAYGAIIKLSPESTLSHRGARFQACRESSRHGVSVMVSSDGDIEMLTQDRPLLRL